MKNAGWVGRRLAAVAMGTFCVVACAADEVPPEEAREVRWALTSTLLATQDTYVDDGAANTVHGATTTMSVRGNRARALILFDSASIANLTSSTARVELTIAGSASSSWGAHGREVSIFRLLRPWTEMATVNCSTDAAPANGQADCSGATAWNARTNAFPPIWAVPATSKATIAKGQTGVVSWDVSADVARFRSGTPNYGWIVWKDEPGNAGDVDFATRESTSPPRLVVTSFTNYTRT